MLQVFSAYGPQLAKRLTISHTKLNVIGLSGNVGVYSTAPLWGKLVDSRGPKIGLLCAFVLLLSGYLGIKVLYDTGVAADGPVFAALILSALATGAGGNAGNTSGVNAVAKSFPDRARASATGLVLSGFGLSAFLFSTAARVLFPGDTTSFLTLLALGTALPQLVGLWLVKTVPFEEDDGSDVLFHADPDPVFRHANTSRTPLLAAEEGRVADDLVLHSDSDDEVDDDDDDTPRVHHAVKPSLTPVAAYIPGAAHDVELSPSRGSLERRPTRLNATRSLSRSARLLHEAEHAHIHRVHGHEEAHLHLSDEEEEEEEAHVHPAHAPLNIHGRDLFLSGDFWLLFIIVSTLSGTGLMYINNVGSMSQALYAGSLAAKKTIVEGDLQPPAYDEAAAAALQATQVSVISIMNCAGRIAIGLASDFVKTRLGRVRSVLLIGVATAFCTSQILASNIDDPSWLWVASALLGFSHGSLFGFMPAVVIEWFGMIHFSENWGFLSLAPMFAGNLFSLAFGANLDREGEKEAEAAGLAGAEVVADSAGATTASAGSVVASVGPVVAFAREAVMSAWRRTDADAPDRIAATSASAPDCVAGRSCYTATLHLTAFCCFCALLLSVWAAVRDERKRGRGAR